MFSEENCYYSELSFFFGNSDENVKLKSHQSVSVARVAPANISLETVEYTYSGENNMPNIMLSDEVLVCSVDYMAVFTNNLNAGDVDFASAEITFLNYYKGTQLLLIAY